MVLHLRTNEVWKEQNRLDKENELENEMSFATERILRLENDGSEKYGSTKIENPK